MAALRGVDARIKSGQDGIATLTRAPGIRWVGEWDPLSRDPAERLADIIENVDSIGRDPPGINHVTKSRDENCVFSLSALGGGEGRGEVGGLSEFARNLCVRAFDVAWHIAAPSDNRAIVIRGAKALGRLVNGGSLESESGGGPHALTPTRRIPVPRRMVL